MTQLDDITAALGADAEKYSPDAVSRVLEAERSAQASRVRLNAAEAADRPTALDEALLARVRYNLEQTEGAEPVTRIGIKADGVRDLEHPFTLRGRAEVPEPAPAARARRTTKKAASKRAAKKTTAKTAAKKASGN